MQRLRFGSFINVSILLAGAAVAQERPAEPVFALHGFIAGSVYAQDALTATAEGQGAVFVTSKPANNNYLFGADVRETRINLTFTSPVKVLGSATPRAFAEFDFFGGNSSGAFGTESVLPRLRLAWAELNWGDTSVLVGQAFTLTYATLGQVTVGHVAFPNFGAGLVAWRYPGIFFSQKFGTPAGQVELAAMAARGSWNNSGLASFAPPSGTLNPPPGGVSIGSAFPQFEARVALSGKGSSGLGYYAFAAGHYDRKKISGYGSSNDGSNILEGYSGNGGARATYGPFTVQGGGYYGRAIGNILGQAIQFGDIRSWGAWGQVGAQMNPGLGLWAFAGTDHPNGDDVRAAMDLPATSPLKMGPNSRLQNVATTAMLRYLSGPYVVAFEWFHWHTKWTQSGSFDGNQYILTVLYNL